MKTKIMSDYDLFFYVRNIYLLYIFNTFLLFLKI